MDAHPSGTAAVSWANGRIDTFWVETDRSLIYRSVGSTISWPRRSPTSIRCGSTKRAARMNTRVGPRPRGLGGPVKGVLPGHPSHARVSDHRQARITPDEAAGLPSYGQRRVKDLRREEVASPACVSVEDNKRLEPGSRRRVTSSTTPARSALDHPATDTDHAADGRTGQRVIALHPAPAYLECRRSCPPPSRAGHGDRRGRRGCRRAAGGDAPDAARLAWRAGAGRLRRVRVLARHGGRAEDTPNPWRPHRDARPACAPATAARHAVARAHRLLRRARRGGRQPPFADLAGAGPGQDPHARSGGGVPGPTPASPRVLCGDLNTPRRELPDGQILTFAHDSSGRLRPERGERWNQAERALVHGLREHGWVDAFRALHGYGEREASWTFHGDRGGWRLDHVLLLGLRPIGATYAHEWRRIGLSDHSALIVDVR